MNMKQQNFTTIIVIIVMMFASVTVNAQIVYSNGKLNINNPRDEYFYHLNINTWAGLYWTVKSNRNFFQLDISPNNPRLAGTGDKIVFYNTQTHTYNAIEVADVYNYSDERAKANIQSLTSGLDAIMELNPVSYNWKRSNEATKASLSGDSLFTATGPADEVLRYGFLAQDVEKIIPNAVKTDDDGHKMVNYNTILTVLVQAVKELQVIVEEQSRRIEELTVENGVCPKSQTVKNSILNCSPNPTFGMVVIDAQISEETRSAVIVVRNLDGMEEKRVSLSTDSPSISVDLSSLKEGMHIVTLIADGVICDSVRLIKE